MIAIHQFLNEYGLSLSVFLVALVCICFLIDRATRYHEQDLLEAERKYANGEFNANS